MPITGADHSLTIARLGILRLGASRVDDVSARLIARLGILRLRAGRLDDHGPRIFDHTIVFDTGHHFETSLFSIGSESLDLATGHLYLPSGAIVLERTLQFDAAHAITSFGGFLHAREINLESAVALSAARVVARLSAVTFGAGAAIVWVYGAVAIIGTGGLLLAGNTLIQRHVRLASPGGLLIGPSTSASEAFRRKYAIHGRAGPHTQVTGILYDPEGQIVTYGTLVLTPASFFTKEDFLCSANISSVIIPPSGILDFVVVPGEYLSELDPDPDDIFTPRALKRGYFANNWVVPDSYQSTVLAKTGLMAYWRVANSADSSGHGHTLTPSNLAFGSGGGGLADNNSAAEFAGTTSAYAIANPFTSFTTDEVTIEMLVKTTATDVALFSYAVAGRGDEIYIAIGASGHLEATVRGTAPVVTLAGPVDDNVYHHVAVTWRSASGTVRIYRDGLLLAQGTRAATELLAPTGSVVLGQRQGTVGGTFTKSFAGRLDEVAIYERVLLSPEVVRNASMRTILAVTTGSL